MMSTDSSPAPFQQPYLHYNHRAPGTSISSAGCASNLTSPTLDTVDLEKACAEPQWEPSQNQGPGGVKGKREMAERQQHPLHHHHNLHSSTPPSNQRDIGNHVACDRRSWASDVDLEQDMQDQRLLLESKALKILLFLSGPCAALSFILCLWSIFASLAIFLVAPVRLCTTHKSSLWEQILSIFTSAQRLQLRCIYAPTADTQGKSVLSLACNFLLAPLLSLGVVVAAWTVAIYWIFAAIVGDPDGSEGGNDGVATVLGLRGWWEKWLVRAMVQQ